MTVAVLPVVTEELVATWWSLEVTREELSQSQQQLQCKEEELVELQRCTEGELEAFQQSVCEWEGHAEILARG